MQKLISSQAITEKTENGLSEKLLRPNASRVFTRIAEAHIFFPVLEFNIPSHTWYFRRLDSKGNNPVNRPSRKPDKSLRVGIYFAAASMRDYVCRRKLSYFRNYLMRTRLDTNQTIQVSRRQLKETTMLPLRIRFFASYL